MAGSHAELGNTEAVNVAVEYCLLVHAYQQRVNQSKVACGVLINIFLVALVTGVVGHTLEFSQTFQTVCFSITGFGAIGIILSLVCLAVFLM